MQIIEKKESFVLLNFSGIYEYQNFYKEDDFCIIDVREMTGTNCYCDDLAHQELTDRIKMLPYEGIHFCDSGNYHYMSRIWIEKIQEPFRLLVMDNHTDLQLPAFGGILSCGGWIAAALEEIPELQEVILIGPDEDAYQMVENVYKDRIHFYSREKLGKKLPDEWIRQLTWDLPIYISVDKDILNQDEVSTNWSQGEMLLEELMSVLKLAASEVRNSGTKILGMDVCGECDSTMLEMIEESNSINQKCLEFWKNRNIPSIRRENV